MTTICATNVHTITQISVFNPNAVTNTNIINISNPNVTSLDVKNFIISFIISLDLLSKTHKRLVIYANVHAANHEIITDNCNSNAFAASSIVNNKRYFTPKLYLHAQYNFTLLYELLQDKLLKKRKKYADVKIISRYSIFFLFNIKATNKDIINASDKIIQKE